MVRFYRSQVHTGFVDYMYIHISLTESKKKKLQKSMKYTSTDIVVCVVMWQLQIVRFYSQFRYFYILGSAVNGVAIGHSKIGDDTEENVWL